MNGLPSVAAQIIITIIPIVGIVMGAVVIFFSLLWTHREKMTLIEKGNYQPRKIDLYVFSLLAGLLLLAVGLVLSVFFVAMEGMSYSLLGGLIPLTLGVSFIIFYGMGKYGKR
jgi:hypothetical protein